MFKQESYSIVNGLPGYLEMAFMKCLDEILDLPDRINKIDYINKQEFVSLTKGFCDKIKQFGKLLADIDKLV